MDSAAATMSGKASHAEAPQEFREPASMDCVAAFHRRFGVPVEGTPALPSRARMDLRLNLIEEEVRELRAAMDAGDLVESADALADIQYVLSGTVHELGMGHCFAELVEEVQRSNMSKACATLQEAEQTVEHYREQRGVEASIEEMELDGETAYLVKRVSDGKTLKSIAYSPPDLAPILARAGAREADLGPTEELAAAGA
uniref:Phosphoribosyl-ATP diphosphatase n=1 Tax=Alexandrium monilatum TaxID=311494 RepID=A0A7S4S803_9DINO